MRDYEVIENVVFTTILTLRRLCCWEDVKAISYRNFFTENGNMLFYTIATIYFHHLGHHVN